MSSIEVPVEYIIGGSIALLVLAVIGRHVIKGMLRDAHAEGEHTGRQDGINEGRRDGGLPPIQW